MDREREGDGLADVVVDAPAEANRGDDRRKVIVEQDQGRRFARHVRAASSHGDADVRGFQGRCVIDAIAGHGHDFPTGLEGHDDAHGDVHLH